MQREQQKFHRPPTKLFFFSVSRIRTFQGLLKSKKTDSKTNQYYHSSDLVNHRMTEMYLGWP